ncbi:LysR family transcriptional regulator [Streptomyces sp. NPDC051018]|uniref:LysR family transcriptional regulator n=1 Tax=Streptomyces sp. NPDC051018 TaxID=3365639 RepID=UPI0037AD8D20
MTIELRHLRAFLAIAEESSVTRAAARLHLTQPALSRSLAALEKHLGVRLMDRSTHHLTLTDEGRIFREKAASAVAAFDDAVDTAGLRGRPLRLGHAWAALGPYTTPLLRRWEREHPDTPLELLRIDDRTAGLVRGRVDVAVLRGSVDEPGLVTVPLFTEPRVAAVTSDGPLAALPRLTLADLASGPVLVNPVSGITTLDLWPPDARPATTVTVTNTDDWLTAIAAGRGAGVSAASTAKVHPHPGVTFRPLPDAPPVPVLLAHRAGPTHPAVPQLVALARELTRPPGRHGEPAAFSGP